MPLKAGDHLGAGVLICAHDLPELFGVKLRRERGRADQVTEEHGELAPFRLWRGGGSRRRCRLGSRRLWRGRWRGVLGGRWRRGWRRLRVASPDQDAVVLISGQLLGI